jgi:NAD(P)-dependent dehydrogenase (short-subunit alcohol dehydrogenase family)
MQTPHYRSALIVGTGPGLSASLARLFAKHGLSVAIAARQTDKLAALAAETGASVRRCNAAAPTDVAALFAAVETKGQAPDVVVYNASARASAPRWSTWPPTT